MKHQILILADKQDDQVKTVTFSGFEATVVHDVETALEKLHQSVFNVIVYDSTFSSIDENKLQAISRLLHQEIILFRKDSQTAWKDSVSATIPLLKQQQKRKIIITDDVLKDTKFNIMLN